MKIFSKLGCGFAAARVAAVVGAGLLAVSGPAWAQSAEDNLLRGHQIDPTLEGQQTKIAEGMTTEEVLVIQSAIERAWASYTLLLDGDGTALYTAQWPSLTFTDDVEWTFFDLQGDLIFRLDSEETMDIGRMEAAVSRITHRPWKHLPIITKFDEITPTTAKTRTVLVFMSVPKATEPNTPDGVEGLSTPAVPQVGMAVYHDTWRKEDGIWMKSASAFYASNCGWFPAGPPSPTYSCMDEEATAASAPSDEED